MSEFGQKDSEYTEDYAVLPQRQMDSLISLHDAFEEIKPIPKPRLVILVHCYIFSYKFILILHSLLFYKFSKQLHYLYADSK